MHVHTNDVVISHSNSIANNKSPLPQFDKTIPGCVSSFWTHQQGMSRNYQKPKSHICNNIKNEVSFYCKFLRTHHARGACYHFGTRIPSVSKMWCTTRRVYSNQDLFKTLTFMNIARDHLNRDMCEGICNRKIPNFSYYCKYGILVFCNDGTGPANESKRTKRIQGWSRQIMGGSFCYLQYYYSVK